VRRRELLKFIRTQPFSKAWRRFAVPPHPCMFFSPQSFPGHDCIAPNL
jgi:hypothetical protein